MYRYNVGVGTCTHTCIHVDVGVNVCVLTLHFVHVGVCLYLLFLLCFHVNVCMLFRGMAGINFNGVVSAAVCAAVYVCAGIMLKLT